MSPDQQQSQSNGMPSPAQPVYPNVAPSTPYDQSDQFNPRPSSQPMAPVVPNMMRPETSQFAPSSFEPNTPATNPMSNPQPMSDEPVAIVKAYSVKGIEYGMMTFSLLLGAGSLIGTLASLINGGSSLSDLAFPIALMITTFPIFAFFFFRLKKAEIANPELKFDASRRRFSQLTQFLAFFTCLFSVASFIFVILSKFSSSGSYSIVKSIEDLLIVLVIAGGILVYYWLSDHRLVKNK